MSFRQICKVIKSDSGKRKITIEVDGKILLVEKIIGLEFQQGDYACYQSFDGFKKSLVVALNPEEIKQLKDNENNYDFGSLKNESFSKEELDFPVPDMGVVPLDEEIFRSQLENEKNKKPLFADSLNDKEALEIINTLFSGDMSVKEEEETVRKLFPMVAIQQSEEDQEMKEIFFQKADDVIIRKLINEQTNREVHEFLSNMISRIDDEKDHQDFFHNLGFYLDRLKKMQKYKKLSSKKMGIIFYPVYIFYVKKFTREKIDAWIDGTSEFNF